MASLREFLIDKGYYRIRLFPSVTNHLQLQAKINGVEGSFILDTGASSSCIAFEFESLFQLQSEESDVKAAGAGATNMRTELSKENSIKIGRWKKDNIALVLFDLAHVNAALEDHGAAPVHGILGADILNKGKGVIDYQYNCLYLK